MDVKEAYRVLQAECGIEKGDKVKLLRAAKPGEMGWCYGWEKSYSKHIGDIGVVDRVTSTDNGFYIVFAHSGIYAPFFCLELVEKAKPELPPIMVGGNEVEFYEGHITVGCERISHGTVKTIVKRLKK